MNAKQRDFLVYLVLPLVACALFILSLSITLAHIDAVRQYPYLELDHNGQHLDVRLELSRHQLTCIATLQGADPGPDFIFVVSEPQAGQIAVEDENILVAVDIGTSRVITLQVLHQGEKIALVTWKIDDCSIVGKKVL